MMNESSKRVFNPAYKNRPLPPLPDEEHAVRSAHQPHLTRCQESHQTTISCKYSATNCPVKTVRFAEDEKFHNLNKEVETIQCMSENIPLSEDSRDLLENNDNEEHDFVDGVLFYTIPNKITSQVRLENRHNKRDGSCDVILSHSVSNVDTVNNDQEYSKKTMEGVFWYYIFLVFVITCACLNIIFSDKKLVIDITTSFFNVCISSIVLFSFLLIWVFYYKNTRILCANIFKILKFGMALIIVALIVLSVILYAVFFEAIKFDPTWILSINNSSYEH